jgi:hypothetical protein
MLKAIQNPESDAQSTRLILGLSRVNCERLLMGQPIVVKCTEIGLTFNLDIILMGGETELKIMAELKTAGMEFPENIYIDPRLKE